METQTKTQVQIVQELIAIHTTRIEAVEKLQEKEYANEVSGMLSSAKEQSERFTAELMNELSQFGDSVMANVDNENEYQRTWKNVLEEVDSMASKKAEQIFFTLESTLKNTYQNILNTETNLPDSLHEIISQQEKEIVPRSTAI